jgi:hypothetical protein
MAGSFADYLAPRILDHVLRNTAYTPVATVYLALSTTVPTDGGGVTEPSGGSYARTACSFSAASGRQIQNSGAVTFPAATADWGTIVGWALYDASSGGNILFFGECLATPKVFTADASTDVLTSTAHGYTDTTRVQVEAENGALPSGLSDNTTYFVRDATSNTFKLALTSGGAAIDITTNGNGTLWVAGDFKKTVQNGDTYSMPTAQVTVRIRSNLGT